jgi:hypothetical protein
VCLKQRTFNYYWYEAGSSDQLYKDEPSARILIPEHEALAQKQFEAKIQHSDKRMQVFFGKQASTTDESLNRIPIARVILSLRMFCLMFKVLKQYCQRSVLESHAN